MIAIKSQPARRANFEGDYPLLIPRVNSPRFQAELDQWYFDFKTVLMRQRTELYDFVNDEINQLDEAQADIVVVEDDVEEIQGEITIINNHLTQIDNSITNINTQLITVTHIVTTFVLNAATGDGIVQSNGTGNPQSSILGSPGYFTYWRASDPYLAANSPLYTDGTNVGIATTTPGVLFDLGLAGTTAGVMRLAGSTSGNVTINTAAAAGAWTLTLPTTDGAANEFLKTNGTGVTTWSSVVLTTDVSGLLPTANGGTNHGNYTAGSVIFAGAGGMLLTEDNANLFWDDANNRLGVGTAVPVTELSVVSTSASDPRGIMSAQYSTDAVGARMHFRKARGTEALPTTVVTGDVLGRIRFSGYDGANHLQMGSIDVGSSGTIGATRVPTYMSFSVATDAAPSVFTERMRIISSGNVGIGIAAPVQKLDVLGTAAGTDTFVRIGSTAGNLDAGFILYNVTDAADSWAFFRKDTGYFAISHSTGNFPAGTITARFRIETNGNVGVGPSVPLFRLDANINDAVATVTDVLRLNHSLTGGTAANFGTGILLTGKTSTTNDSDMARIQTIWTDSTHATRTSALQFQTVNSAAALATRMSLSGAGGLSVGDATTTTAVGVINAVTGYRIASGAATAATYLRGNGTNFVGSVISPSDITYAFTEGSVLFAGPGGTTISQDNAAFFWDNTNNFLGLGTAVPLVLLHLNTAGFNDTSILFENANGYAAIELDGPTGDFKVSSLFGELQFVAGNQVHLSMDGVGNTLVVSGLGTISGYFSATGNVGIGTNATAPGALLDLGLAGTTLGVMRMAGSTSGNVTIQPAAIAGTWTLTLPVNDGNNLDVLTTNGAGVTSWTAPSSISTPVSIANGGTNQTAFNTDSVIFFDGTRLTDDGAAFTYGTGGDNLLSVARTMGEAVSDIVGIQVLNSSGAILGTQQWSPTIMWEGQGWSTINGSRSVRFSAHVAPVVSATANPTGYWALTFNINNAVTHTEIMRADTTGYVRITKDDLRSIDNTLAQSVFGLQLENATATTAPITTQDAPTLMFKGSAWNSSALSANDWRWRILMKGVTVAGTPRSYLRIDSGLNGASFANPIIFSSAGGLSVGSLIEPANGIISAQAGFQVAGSAPLATPAWFLKANGTAYVAGNIAAGDIPAAAMTHVMLNSAVHTDTLTAAVARGALIVGNSTPAWARLTVGTRKLLVCDGTDTTWSTDLTWDETANQLNAIGSAATAVVPIYVSNADNSAVATQETAYGFRFGFTGGGASLTPSGLITCGKEQEWSGVAATNDSSIFIETAENGTITEGFQVHSSGSCICGKDDTSTTRTDDFTYICQTNGVPTGVPAAFGSRVPITFDPNTDTLYVYSGGWKGVVVV